MKQWLTGLLFGCVLAVWSLYDIFTEPTPSALTQIMNYAGLIAGVVMVFGGVVMRSKEQAPS